MSPADPVALLGQVALFAGAVTLLAVVAVRAGIIVGGRIDHRLERGEEDEDAGDRDR